MTPPIFSASRRRGLPLRAARSLATICICLLCGCEGPIARLERQLTEGDLAARQQAARQLAERGAEAATAVDPLVATLADQDADLRRLSAFALGQMGSAASESVPALVGALADTEPSVRWAAAYALVEIAPQHTAAVPILAEAYRAGDVRAVLTLGKCQSAAASDAVPVLISAVGDKRSLVRLKAVESLARLGPAAEAALPVLRRASADPQLDVREGAAAAIAAISGGGP